MGLEVSLKVKVFSRREVAAEVESKGEELSRSWVAVVKKEGWSVLVGETAVVCLVRFLKLSKMSLKNVVFLIVYT